ncbi:hypothetical protein [Anaeromicropila populeti]|uniref:Uncharacterized protein n=1 Tax=Anaeromicropila populeti TaxID=37658 RepID=A0A1I6JLL3_9FIRM|nr:hypothetical protein [Anaeromicropila populeti]SFR79865.1 hypothetical protein SAMN05661086_01726 [Anaeromicropila populeti]
MSILNDQDIPIGFGMALAQNLDAMSYFSGLDKPSQQQIINKTHDIHSKKEMQNFVSKLSDHDSFF